MRIVRPPVAVISHAVPIDIVVMAIGDSIVVEVAVVLILNAVPVQIASAPAVVHAVVIAIDLAARRDISAVA